MRASWRSIGWASRLFRISAARSRTKVSYPFAGGMTPPLPATAPAAALAAAVAAPPPPLTPVERPEARCASGSFTASISLC
ncbi:hypothetical protein BKA57DRAFT_461944 [Linnemannia elongata]|nr:hypothetical protein BKA57DRAFT_461944 [Linnemannia elongata]